MAQEILTGNPLSDGVLYHASDINAAINNATLLPGAISNQPFIPATDSMSILTSPGGAGGGPGAALNSTSLLSVKTLVRTNMQTTGMLDAHEGLAVSNILGVVASGTQNDYNPTNFSKCTILAVNGTVNITGMAAPSIAGVLKIIYNFGAGTVTISRENVASIAQNRFTYVVGAPQIDLAPGQCATCVYTVGANARWLVLCTNRTL